MSARAVGAEKLQRVVEAVSHVGVHICTYVYGCVCERERDRERAHVGTECVLPCAAVCCSVLQRVAVCWSVAVCCSVS